jgi:DNA-directed RNA polymerase subunit alpha
MPAKSANGLPVGALPVDAVFTPVQKVNFSVEAIKPGQEGSPEKLVIEIWTDATILPWEALNQSAIILINQLSAFRDLEIPMAKTLSILPEQYDTPLEKLNLSTRSCNSLRRAGISTLGQLVEKSREGLPPLPGLGAKSRAEVEELMAKLGTPVPEEKKK